MKGSDGYVVFKHEKTDGKRKWVIRCERGIEFDKKQSDNDKS